MPHDPELPRTSLQNAPTIPPKSLVDSRPGSKSHADVDREIVEGFALAVRRIIARLVSEQETQRTRESGHHPPDGCGNGDV